MCAPFSQRNAVMRNEKKRTWVWVWEEWKRRWRRKKSVRRERGRERGGENPESSLPGVGFTVIFSRYDVFKQLAAGDPVEKNKESITNCN